MRKLKKWVALCLCMAMVASIGLSANAATEIDFYIDSVGGYNSDATAKKTLEGQANVNYATISFSGSYGDLWTYIRKSSTQVTNRKYLTSSYTGQNLYAYWSGKDVIGNYYNIYGKTDTSCGYGARLTGYWTP